MRWRVPICGGLMLWAATTVGLRAESPVEPQPIVTSSFDFKVPFVVDPNEQAVSVQLHVSTDRGMSWHLAQTVAPGAGKFAFQAPFAGEFWFAVRTVDAKGRVIQVEEFAPELRVLVGVPEKPSLTAEKAVLDSTQAPSNNSAMLVSSFEVPRGSSQQGDIRPRMVNSRTLDIDYEAPTGADTPREIAVWLTRDGGNKWERHTVDADCKSPARVTVENDGLYGLWIVMTDASGNRAAEPRSGEAPGVWIGVDTSPPHAQLLTAEADTVRGERELTVRWEASDAKLGVAPVSLSFRRTPDEPWQPLASNVLNSGVQRVKLDRSLTQNVQLRLDVRDEAGNVTSVETREPVSTIARSVIPQGPSEQATIRGSRTYQVLR
jgi:hypothetical protein